MPKLIILENVVSLKTDFTEVWALIITELKKLIELREALVALKGPLGNVPSFRSKLQELLDNDDAREKLLAELELATDGGE